MKKSMASWNAVKANSRLVDFIVQKEDDEPDDDYYY